MISQKTSTLSAVLLVYLFSCCNPYSDNIETQEQTDTIAVAELPIASTDGGYSNYKNPENENNSPKNIILLIGDGMGINQIIATRYRYYGIKGKLTMEKFPFVAMVNTSSEGDDLITDSAAGATAMATGKKTKNGMVGMDQDSIKSHTLLEKYKSLGMAIGFITTGNLAGATPGAFLSHVPDRDMAAAIAEQIIRSESDFLYGESEGFFEAITSEELNNEGSANVLGYNFSTNDYPFIANSEQRQLILFDSLINEYESLYKGKLIPNPIAPSLSAVTTDAIQFLNNRNENGFFLVVEEDKIDSWGHDNHLAFTTWHVNNLDHAVKSALEFAEKDKETLVLVTADHETGGLNIVDASRRTMRFKAIFSTEEHTAQPVPLYAFGPGSALFQGTIENSEIFSLINKLLTPTD